MKKIYILLCIAAILLIFTGVQKSQAEMKQQVPTRTYVKKPDLVGSITFVDVKPFKNWKGYQCWSYRTIFSVTNRGENTAHNFKCAFLNKRLNANNWVGMYEYPYEILGAGKTDTWGFLREQWCANQEKELKLYRIKVDTKNTVAESNEMNNVAEKTFSPTPRTRTMEKW